MLKFSHRTLIILSGLVWFVVGFFLLRQGLVLLMDLSQPGANWMPFVNSIAPFLSSYAVTAILVLAMVIGYFKGRFVLGKSAKQGIARIMSFPNPTGIHNLYSRKYYILLGSMILLGVSIKYMGLPNDVRGFVDVAIGMALFSGARVYFQHAVGIEQKV